MTDPIPPHRLGFRRAVAALALTAALGACGSTGPGGAGPGQTSTPGQGSAPGRQATTTTAAGEEAAGSPLDQLFGDGSAANRAIEDKVAACMRGRGWQYTPAPNLGGAVGIGVVTTSANDPAFIERYGYGISTQPPVESAGADEPENPNAKYLNSLSEADQKRYARDLSGDDLAGSGGNDSPVAFTIDPSSCYGQAQKEVAKDHPELTDAFTTRFGELLKATRDDPRMVAANARWSACMARSKFTYANVEDVYADLQARADKLQGVPGAAAGGGEPRAIQLPGSGNAGPAGPTTTLSPGDQERLTRLQAEERAIAKADVACRKDTVDPVRRTLDSEIADKLRSEFPGLGGGR